MSFGSQTSLTSVDTQASISTNATAPNLPGPGRNLGLLFDRGGDQVETLMNKFANNRRNVDATPNNPRTSLLSIDSHPSVSTNATAPNLPGPGRNLGLLLSRVGNQIETLLNKCANRFGMGPISVAKEIRLLCRHNEMTILELYTLSSRHLTDREVKKVKKRCKKLLKFVRSILLSTQIAALDQVTALAIEDSLIREMFAECQLENLDPKYDEPDLLTASAKALSSIKEAATHEFWSKIILQSEPVLDRDFIRNSLTDPNTSFIAARHISSVLRSSTSDVSSALIFEYIQAARKTWWNIECSNLSRCISDIERLHHSSFNTLSFFHALVEDIGERVVKQMIREQHSSPEFLYLICPMPQVEFDAGRDTPNIETSIVGVTDFRLDEFASLCVMLLKGLSGSDDFGGQITFIRNCDTAIRRLLDGAALLDELCIAYCHLKHFCDNETSIPGGREFLTKRDAPAVSILARALEDESSPNRQMLAAFLTVRFGALNRYCKLAMPPQIGNILNSRPFLFLTDLKESLTSSSTPKDSYILRLTVDGSSSTHRRRRIVTPKMLTRESETIAKISQKYLGRDIRIDILPYNVDEVIEIDVGGTESFNATGHFPVLVGYDESCRALYCALQRWGLKLYSSCVIDGSSNAVFSRDIEESWISDVFSVMALRSDPSDTITHAASCVEGAMDPTGPLHWRELWPEEDTCVKSLMDEENYRGLKTKVLPPLEKIAEDAEWEDIYAREFQNLMHAKQKSSDGELSSAEALRYFRVLPFSKNRMVTPASTNEENKNDDTRETGGSMSANEIDGRGARCSDSDVSADCAEIPKASDERLVSVTDQTITPQYQNREQAQTTDFHTTSRSDRSNRL
ncbi:hypothetical protein SCHPADRAFT_933077 [Schizopora paradoxa]|uniref:Uncharacterized protein n=1 Tax=Schizopora paradoxa TaxID=27342 RepID=A0A0H2R3N5_9AGAM|nr:hypothetical protein SCHPADRAFT_933077 [Schizopora paradoxa]